MSTVADQAFGFGTPFQAQIDYLRNKLRLPTDRWDDIMRSAHDRAFIVAGVAKADLLADLHQAVVERAVDGAGLQAFRKDFKAIVAKHGWTGWTGEGSTEGEAWRTRIIYQTNMSTSYSAGRWAQMSDPEVLRFHPYWRYIHADGVLHPRQQHLAWHGFTALSTHPFWRTHWAPNGFGCQCRIISVTKREGEASVRAGLGELPAGWNAIAPQTGDPVGVGKGFGYAPGASVDVALRQMVQDKLISYPPAISKALAADVGRYVNSTEAAASFAARVLADRSVTEPLFVGFVDAVDTVSPAAGTPVQGYFVTIPSDAPRHVEVSHGNDGKGQRAAMPADFEQVLSVLNDADQVKAGAKSRNGNATVVAVKKISGETYRAVFEVLPGKKNRALALLSMVIKTPK
ncbi:phage minor head protein [Rhodoferax sp. BLA1]|uniref:phage minor head protein n=1 Tax=Rhodoferax sp. BLA1 TaxID=2576062 RepID=UPI0015D24D78|nr:phage minor head protein [Rhodoferax sp. BLA1]